MQTLYISRREYIKVIHIDKFGSVKTIEKDTLSELIVYLLENNKAHISKMGENISTKGTSIMACIQRIRRFLSNKRISPFLTSCTIDISDASAS